MALLYTPREEDPQIKVPMVDILIRFPGASPQEVENLVVINLEKKLWEMEGLEDLYSQAKDGFAIVTAKFKVGENLETSLFKVYNKVFSNIDQVPYGVAGWVVKPMNINDVPIVTLTLYSNAADDYELRRVADELLHRLQGIPDTGRSYVVAGRKRQVRVVADPTAPGRPRPGFGGGGPGHRGQQRQSAGGNLLPPGPGIRGGGRAVSQERR